MSRFEEFPARRAPARAAVLDLVAEKASQGLGPEEAEFLAALRRIVARTPVEDLWDKYHGSCPDATAHILARYAD